MDIYKDLLSDISDFAIVVFGFCISLYTLLYSFILNKTDLLQDIAEEVKLGNLVVNKTQKETNYIRYIKRMRQINSYYIKCIWFSLIIYFLSLLVKYTEKILIEIKLDDIVYIINTAYILLSFAFILIIYIVLILINSIKIYNKNTTISE